MIGNINLMFQNSVQHWGNRAALRQRKPDGWREISWNQWNEGVRDVCLGLYAMGLKDGDRAGLIGKNCIEWVTADLGILAARGVVVPIYLTNPAHEIAYILENSGAKFVILEDAEQLGKVMETRHKLPELKRAIVWDSSDVETDDFVMTFDKLKELGRETNRKQPGLFEELLKGPDRKSLATIVYTSGTTGPPKGAMISHGNILFICESMDGVVPASETDTTLSFLPLCHVFERMGGEFPSIYKGVTVNYAQSLETIARDIADTRPTILLAVPRVCEKIYGAIRQKVETSPAIARAIFHWSLGVGRKMTPYKLAHGSPSIFLGIQYAVAKKMVFNKLREAVGGRLRFMVAAGAPLAVEVAQFFHASDIFVVEGYGATETSAPVSFNTLNNCKIGTVGKLIPGVDVKFDTDGEILVKGGNVFMGYWKMEEATRDAFTSDGWFRTGDIGEFDEEGYLKITDRKKDLIITAGGKNIAPQNIENRMVNDPLISQFVVYGDRRKYLTALVTLDEAELKRWAAGQNIEEKEYVALTRHPKVVEEARRRIEAVNRELARYETIKDFCILDHVFTENSGELTPTQKVKRKVITKKYKELLDSMYDEVY